MALSNVLNKELFSRVLSTIIIVPMIIILTNLGGYYFASMIVILVILMSMEWVTLTLNNNKVNLWRLLGVVYIFIPSIALLWLGNQEYGSKTVISLFLLVWSTDIGAFFVGKSVGGPKLIPHVSKNKTWSGFCGGLFAALIIGFIFTQFNIIEIILISFIAQIGDLVESKIKRIFDASDSGDFIPGHGGILDAVDGVMFAAPFLALIRLLYAF